MVQGWLDESVKGVKYIGAPSVQLFCHDDHVCLYDVTDQILTSDSVHEGNVAPPMYQDEHPQLQDELLRQAEVAGRWLHAQGYRGTGSVDFQFIYRNGEPEVRVCEINARVTGATYPSLLARHFSPKGAWLMRNIRFHPPKKGREIVAALEGAGLLYHKGQEQGVLPFNFNPDAGNMVIKGQFLFLAKTPDVAYTLLDKMRLTRSLQGEYDRD